MPKKSVQHAVVLFLYRKGPSTKAAIRAEVPGAEECLSTYDDRMLRGHVHVIPPGSGYHPGDGMYGCGDDRCHYRLTRTQNAKPDDECWYQQTKECHRNEKGKPVKVYELTARGRALAETLVGNA